MILLLLMVAPAFMHSLLPVACDASKVACKNKAYLLYRLFGRYSPLMWLVKRKNKIIIVAW